MLTAAAAADKHTHIVTTEKEKKRENHTTGKYDRTMFGVAFGTCLLLRLVVRLGCVLRLRLICAFVLRLCVCSILWARLVSAFANAAFAFKCKPDAKICSTHQ